MENLTFEQCDYSNPSHLNLLVELLAEYMADPMGEHAPHNKLQQLRLVDALANNDKATVIFAVDANDRGVGMAVCFELFSTFEIKPYLYIHDFVVRGECRCQGVGTALLGHLTELSQQRKYCKLTLEVRSDNPAAQRIYNKEGFEPCEPNMYFWRKRL